MTQIALKTSKKRSEMHIQTTEILRNLYRKSTENDKISGCYQNDFFLKKKPCLEATKTTGCKTTGCKCLAQPLHTPFTQLVSSLYIPYVLETLVQHHYLFITTSDLHLKYAENAQGFQKEGARNV